MIMTLGLLIASLVQKLCQVRALCPLSRKYTNHCIRATEATLLSQASFSPAQIMLVTGHKSVSSLSVYQQVSTTEKLAMVTSLAPHMLPQKSAPIENDFASLEFEEWSIDLNNLKMQPKRNSYGLPISNNCTIGTLNIM